MRRGRPRADAAASGAHSGSGGARPKSVRVERRDGAGSGPNHPGNSNSVRRPLRWKARKNRLGSAAEKQDNSGEHHARAANGNQDGSAAPALWAGAATKDEAMRQLVNNPRSKLRG